MALVACWKFRDASTSDGERPIDVTTTASRFALVPNCASIVLGDTPAECAMAGIVVLAQPTSSKLAWAAATIPARVRSAAAVRAGALYGRVAGFVTTREGYTPIQWGQAP